MATSLIFNSKDDAKQYLLNQTEGPDGKHMIARYWKGGEGSDIASVEGILHRTNGVVNVEVKDGESSSSGGSGRQFVVKKPFPIFPASYLNYYYQGTGIKLELPEVRDGDVLQVIFPSNLYLSDEFDTRTSDEDEINRNRERERRSRSRSRSRNNSLSRSYSRSISRSYSDENLSNENHSGSPSDSYSASNY